MKADMMESPKQVSQAILVIWTTFAVAALASLLAYLTHMSTQGDFMGALITYALLCIIPYKLGNGSNAARYVYAVLLVLSVLVLLAGVGATNKLESLVGGLLLIPQSLAAFWLFSMEANGWFRTAGRR